MLPKFRAKTASEKKMLSYEFSWNGDELFCREAYENAEGLPAHLENVGGLLAEVMKMADLTRIEVHGPAAELENLKKPLAPSILRGSRSSVRSKKISRSARKSRNRMTRIGATIVAVAAALAGNVFAGQKSSPANGTDDLFWKKLEARVDEMAERFDGVMGVAIVDLTDDRAILKNADHVFPIASSIKIAILLELYRQEQQARGGTPGKAKLDDIYTFEAKDLVDGSQIMTGLTPGVTRLTNRDLAQFTVAVSDNAAANVLIDRVGMQNVNATLRNLGLTKTLLRRKMMDIAAARQGEENVSTPQEMTRLLEAIYQGKALDKELATAFMKQLSTKKE